MLHALTAEEVSSLIDDFLELFHEMTVLDTRGLSMTSANWQLPRK